jgi:hypothetical protein
MDEEENDDLFDWVANTYTSDNLPETGNQIDLTQYEVSLGSIDKDPLTGNETLNGFEVTKKS